MFSAILDVVKDKPIKLNLRENELLSEAAAVISNMLLSNPSMEHLGFTCNESNDEDATLFPPALRTNTNLKSIVLRHNSNIGSEGVKILHKAIFILNPDNSKFGCGLKPHMQIVHQPHILTLARASK